MESGDGLIVRLHAGSRGFSAAEVRALCRLAETHGNGLIEITRRANLQLRGIREQALPELRRELVELGLASTSALLVNPLAGLSESCLPLETLAQAIETALAASGVLARLPDKFGVIVDGGGDLREFAADIRVERRHPLHAELSLDGDALPLGACALSDVGPAVAALAGVLADSDHRRMRVLVRARGRAELLRAAGLEGELPPPSAAARTDTTMLGFGRGLRSWLGLGLAFGSGTAEHWRAVCELAERFGSGELRVTPFRSVLLPDVSERECAAAGWISDASDPLLRVAACPGAPACLSAAGETRALARELAPLMAAGARLHVSGCAKGCAHSGAADVTLVRVAGDIPGRRAELATGGVKLGFGLSAQQTAEEPSLDLETARARVQTHG